MISAHCATNGIFKITKMRPLQLDLCRFHGFAGTAPHNHLKIHRQSIYKANATKFSVEVVKIAGPHYAKNINKKYEKMRPLEPDLWRFCALHVRARAYIKPHRNSIYKAIATKFTA